MHRSKVDLAKYEVDLAEPYKNHLPHWGNEKYPVLEPFEHRDHGLDADPKFPELLAKGVTTTDLTPTPRSLAYS